MIALLLVAYVVLGCVDSWQTYRCLKKGTCREWNKPLALLMGRFGVGPVLIGKVVWHVGFSVAILALSTILPTASLVVAAVAVAVQMWVVMHNASLRKAAALLFVVALAGCGAKAPPPTVVRIVEPVEVKVPILVRREPPPELLVAPRPPLPTFVDPSDPAASSALTVEGERLLRAWMEEWASAWQAGVAWMLSPADAPLPPTPPAAAPVAGRALADVPSRVAALLRRNGWLRRED